MSTNVAKFPINISHLIINKYKSYSDEVPPLRHNIDDKQRISAKLQNASNIQSDISRERYKIFTWGFLFLIE